MLKTIIEKDRYFDSVFLMLINSSIKEKEGVTNAVVAMGTEMNVDLLKDLGFAGSDVLAATPNDLVIVIEGESQEVLDGASEAVYDLLSKKKKRNAGKTRLPRSLKSAVKEVPEANLVLISLPGEYAAREARAALEQDLNVMLFSDNVSVEEEIELKELAEERGLLMMGPDCGTAIINGHPLCFANEVNRGNIGIVAASGTGLQEVSCCIHTFGGGISQAIGTGGRDLKYPRIGGRMMLMGIEALKQDKSTDVIAVVSKPPFPEVSEKVIRSLEETGKPVVIHFIGQDAQKGRANLHFTSSLEETARLAVTLSKSGESSPGDFAIGPDDIEDIAEWETSRMSSSQKYLRGLYTGGTVADEALILCKKSLETVHTNKDLSDPFVSLEHSIIDLGDDIYTVGRPHPMIDPSTRNERVEREADDEEVAVLLLDIVLGYGSHRDPAGAVAPFLKSAREKAEARGGHLPVIVSVIGTEKDFQGYEASVKTLEEAGCIVMPSNYQASHLALEIVKKAAFL